MLYLINIHITSLPGNELIEIICLVKLSEVLHREYQGDGLIQFYKFNIREAFKRKKRKYIGLLPILGGGLPPDQYISGFFLKKNL